MLELFKCVEDRAGVQEEDIAGAQECSSDNPIAGVQEEEIAEAHEHSSDNATAHLQEAYPDDREPTLCLRGALESCLGVYDYG